jgi:hypothetical protein
MIELQDNELENIRDRFFKMCGLDLWNLDSRELRELLTILPEVQIFIYSRFDQTYVWSDKED